MLSQDAKSEFDKNLDQMDTFLKTLRKIAIKNIFTNQAVYAEGQNQGERNRDHPRNTVITQPCYNFVDQT